MNATHINVNFSGHIFQVKISVALKDQESYFFKCWYTRYCDKYCSGIFLDEEGIYSPLNDGYYELEIITTSLQKLEACSIRTVDEEDESITEIEVVLCDLGFLGEWNRLVDA